MNQTTLIQYCTDDAQCSGNGLCATFTGNATEGGKTVQVIMSKCQCYNGWTGLSFIYNLEGYSCHISQHMLTVFSIFLILAFVRLTVYHIFAFIFETKTRAQPIKKKQEKTANYQKKLFKVFWEFRQKLHRQKQETAKARIDMLLLSLFFEFPLAYTSLLYFLVTQSGLGVSLVFSILFGLCHLIEGYNSAIARYATFNILLTSIVMPPIHCMRIRNRGYWHSLFIILLRLVGFGILIAASTINNQGLRALTLDNGEQELYHTNEASIIENTRVLMVMYQVVSALEALFAARFSYMVSEIIRSLQPILTRADQYTYSEKLDEEFRKSKRQLEVAEQIQNQAMETIQKDNAVAKDGSGKKKTVLLANRHLQGKPPKLERSSSQLVLLDAPKGNLLVRSKSYQKLEKSSNEHPMRAFQRASGRERDPVMNSSRPSENESEVSTINFYTSEHTRYLLHLQSNFTSHVRTCLVIACLNIVFTVPVLHKHHATLFFVVTFLSILSKGNYIFGWKASQSNNTRGFLNGRHIRNHVMPKSLSVLTNSRAGGKSNWNTSVGRGALFFRGGTDHKINAMNQSKVSKGSNTLY
mmetsp:Transcript_29988/g.47641  ORF Transcript_29988/g.47641 Transcript_29988/m.47641 type:complete len:583 (+) Transcript_29988:252-2000(+)